jgi:TPR repeat protein
MAAAQKGNPYAQNNVANMYAQGRGIPCDHSKAKFWYLKAAEQDLAVAQYGLGMLNASDIGKNDPDALQTLPHEPESIAALRKRLQNSLLIVVAR